MFLPAFIFCSLRLYLPLCILEFVLLGWVAVHKDQHGFHISSGFCPSVFGSLDNMVYSKPDLGHQEQ